MTFAARIYSPRVWPLFALAAAPCLVNANSAAQSQLHWESPARLHETFRKPYHGTFTLTDKGVEFHSPKRSLRFLWTDVLTFDLAGPAALTITSYENRPLHEPGNRRFHFTLARSMPPDIAARFAALVERPVINAAPQSGTPVITEVPAHRRGRFGGSNGSLRFREDGVDYITSETRDARSWRWSDLQTIANPGPWEFRVTGWREIVEFDLKQPMPVELFDRLWNRLYANDLNLAVHPESDHR